MLTMTREERTAAAARLTNAAFKTITWLMADHWTIERAMLAVAEELARMETEQEQRRRDAEKADGIPIVDGKPRK